jgi:hypothetical protein
MCIVMPASVNYCRKFPKLLADGGIPLPIPKGKMFSRGEGVLADSLVMVR